MSDFKNTEEIWQWLIDKNKIKSINQGRIFKLKNGKLFCVSDCYFDSMLFNKPEDWSKYIEPKWYEKIPEHGVLCWVSNLSDKEHYRIVRITEVTINKRFFEPGNGTWPFARPLTNEEIKKFLLPD